MATTRDEIQLVVDVDGKRAEKNLGQLKKSLRDLYRQQNKLIPGTKDFAAKAEALGKQIAETKQKIDQAKNAVYGFERAQKNTLNAAQQLKTELKQGLQRAVGAAIAAFAADKIIQFGKELLVTATVLDTYKRKTEQVFQGASVLVEKFARTNATAMGLTRSEYIKAATDIGDLLIPMGFQRDEAAKLSSDLVNLSGALSEWTGGQVDATQTSEILRKALLGEREQLEQLGIKIMEADVSRRLAEKGQRSLTGAALEQAKAMATLELIYEKSGDAQANYAENSDSLVRKQARLTAAMNTMKEQLASTLIPIFSDVVGAMADMSGASDSLADQMEEDQIQMNVLAGKIMQLNEEDEERVRLLRELETRYPAVLEGIDAQTVSNTALRDRLKEVNEQMVNQIVIQSQQEDIEEKLQKAARKKGNALNNEMYLRRQIVKSVQDYGVVVDADASTLEQAEQVQEQLRERQGLLGRVFDGTQFRLEGMSKAMRDMQYWQERSNSTMEEANFMTESMNEMAERLGVTIQSSEETTQEERTRTGRATARLTDAEEKRFVKLQEQREAAIAQVQRAEIELQIELMPEGIEREIATLDLKLRDELKKLDELDIGGDLKLEQKVLLQAKYQQDVARIQSQAISERLEVLRTNYEREIDVLEGTSEEKKEAIQRIAQDTETDAVEIIRQRTEAERAAVERSFNLRIDQAQSEQERLASVMTQLENDLQERISVIRTSTVSEEQKTSELTELESRYAERREVLEAEELAATQLITTLEEQRGAQLNEIQARVQETRREFLQTLREESLSETERLYQQEIAKIEEIKQRLQTEASVAAREGLVAGEDPAVVEQQLKDRLLEIEREFLEKKIALQGEYGVSSLETHAQLEEAKRKETEARIEDEIAREETKNGRILAGLEKVRAGIETVASIEEAITAVQMGSIEQKYQKELESAGDNEKARAQIEEKYRVKREKAERQAALRQKSIAVAMTIIDTVRTIMKIGAQMGIGAPPFQVAAAAFGAAQVAKIIATPLQEGGMARESSRDVKRSTLIDRRSDGRHYWRDRRVVERNTFARGGKVSQATMGLIGEKGPEWVAPNWMVTSPIWGPVIQDMEQARAGKRSTLIERRSDGRHYWRDRRVVERNTFARGGKVSQATMGLIGEKGPEWVAPNWMVTSPIWGPVIQDMEQARGKRANTMVAESPVASLAFALGGSTHHIKKSSVSSDPGTAGDTTQLIANAYAFGGSTRYMANSTAPYMPSYTLLAGFDQGGATSPTLPSDQAVSVARESQETKLLRQEIAQLSGTLANIQFVTVWGERESAMNAEIFDGLQQRRGTEI